MTLLMGFPAPQVAFVESFALGTEDVRQEQGLLVFLHPIQLQEVSLPKSRPYKE